MKREHLLFSLVVLAALMVACVTPPTPTSPPPASPPPTATSSTSPPPTATSFTSPLPTSTSTPPTSSLSTPVSPVDTPVPPTATSAASLSSGGIVPEATGACFHPYYPIRSDTTWRYRTRGPAGATAEFSITYGDITQDGFTVRQTFPDLTTEARWTCTEEGLISSEFASFSLPRMPGFELETFDHAGVGLPPADQWKIGTTWDSSYTVNAEATLAGMAVDSKANIAMRNRIAAIEEVTVPAGTYPQAFRVDLTGTMTISAFAARVSDMSRKIDFDASQWYVEGVGLVKSASDGPMGAFVLELMSVE